ncbi:MULTISPECIES: hypothetical protein [Halolamina]|uniref:Uncharacterized protein n=1 Tax=Halolamina pelagica TaxID=699431 RepID=A0A1I5PWT1_9EURY|nr:MULTISPECIES: hypothetical protein [Halolamina]NHX34969.1 hypothetical protein [Halolamina sp. R1-12]SFP38081.1 hypothetical protein SAMN05216277_103126 [Halolamina pelagica]
MSTEEPTERCYSEIVTRLDEGERETVAEAAALLASTADRMAQVESDGDAEGMAVELRRIADEQARIEEIALAPGSGTN